MVCCLPRFRYDYVFDLVSPDMFMLFACLQIWFNFFSTVSSLKFLGEWRRQKGSTKVKDIQTLSVTDKCLISVSI